MRTRVFAYWVIGIVVILVLFPQQAHSEKKLYVSIYGARLTGDTLGDTFCFNSTYEDSYLVSLAVGGHLFNIGKWMEFELEGQVVKHFEAQHNWKFDGLIAVRWKGIWDVRSMTVVPTSFFQGQHES